VQFTHKTRIAAMLASAALFPSGAWAANTEELQKQIELLRHSIGELQKQVETLQQENNEKATSSDVEGVRADLENYKYDREREYERKNAKSTRDATLFGTVQVRYSAQDEGTNSGNPAPNGERYNTFDVPTAILGVRGNLYKDYVEGRNLEYQLSFAYAKRGTSAHASNSADFNLLDAYLRYNILPTTDGLEGDRLNVTFGQQLLPFGVEAQSTEDLRPTINLATAPGQLGLATRQNGLVFRGDYKPYVDYAANYRAPLFEYAAGVVNGSYGNKLDNNNSKALIVRGAFTLPVPYASLFRELKFGLSAYKGSRAIANGVGKIDSSARQDVYGFDIYYNHAPFGVTYEYYLGKTEYAKSASSADTGTARGVGHTLTLFYTFGDQFFNSVKTAAKFDDSWPQSIQSYYRFDSYNPNKSNDLYNVRGHGFDALRVHTLGFNWFFAETTKLQFGVSHYAYDHETETRKNYNEVQAQFQYTF
jgi:hypothetical protein